MKNKSGLILALIILGTIGLICLSVFGIGENHMMGYANIRQGLDLKGGVSILYEADVPNPTMEEMNSANSLLRRRIDAKGYTEADTALQGLRQIRVDIPGVDDAEGAVEEIGKTAQLIFVDEAGYLMGEDGHALLTGSHVARAEKGLQQITQGGAAEIVVNLEFNSYGAALFEEATRQNIGKRILIYLDDELISDPRVNSVISEGRCYISGNYTAESAEQLATWIREGSLPFKLNVLSMNNVGARLGADALNTSLIAGVIGMLLVLIFMAGIYRVSGLCADWALVIYLGLVMVIVSGMRITLTLPGIAGVILSVGMAVDANVVIFERIREELAAGKTMRAAIDTGYRRAFPAILDSNVTTLIAGVVLFWLGTGPVKGFAQMLIIGILVSMFTCLVVTRLITTCLIGAGVKDPKYYVSFKQESEKKEEAKPPLTFVENRNKFFIFSISVIIVGIIFMVVNLASGKGLFNLGVEFSGGTSFTVDIGKPFENRDIEKIAADVTGQSDAQVQKILNTDMVMVKTRSIEAETRISLVNAISEKYNLDKEAFTYEDVSPTVSADMQRAAILAVLVSSLCMLIYISFRFKDVRMGASSVLAQVHDALVVVALYAVFRIPLNYAFIAVILTTLGYSINATIIIFDRVRENRTLMKRPAHVDLINTSITQTLRRTVYSTITTFLAVLVLYIIGVASIKDFTLPIMAGLLFGGYSSVCLSGSIWYLLVKNKKEA